MKNKSLKKIVDKIKRGKSFMITAHMNLEGDALGSELATYLMLRKLKKKAVIYNHDPTPGIYNFLPYHRVIKNRISENRYDAALVLDCSDSSRAGKVKNALARADSVINIDHHISNTYFGDINWVEPAVSSASQMVYSLCQKFKIMDKNIALCLYTGIFTDTGSFSYANTDSQTHRITANLMRYPIRPDRIHQSLHSLCLPADLNFIGKIVSSLKFSPNKKICWARISRWQDKNYDLNEILFNLMRLLRDPEVLVLFKEVGKERTRINFRSRGEVDVNKIARFFGGGGHKRASGTTLNDNINRAEKKVIPFIKRYATGKKCLNRK